jgi:CRP-like cAMP-binding protein
LRAIVLPTDARRPGTVADRPALTRARPILPGGVNELPERRQPRPASTGEDEVGGSWRIPSPDGPPTPSAIQRRFPAGAFITLAGWRVGAVYLVREGLVQACLPGPRPGRENVVALLGPGDLLGLAALVDQPVYHASDRAVTPVIAWSIAVEDLRRRLLVDAGLRAVVLRAVCRRLVSTQQLVGDQHLRPVGARVARTTAELAARGAPPVPQLVLAALVGARRETVCRQLARLRCPRSSVGEAGAAAGGGAAPAGIATADRQG